MRGMSWFHYFWHLLKPASHWPIIKESEGPQSVVRSDEICSDYFPPIVSIPLPDRRTKSHIGNQKLHPIVRPKSDMADYRRFTSDYYFPPTQVLPLPDFSSDFSSDPPILPSVGQWDAGFIWGAIASLKVMLNPYKQNFCKTQQCALTMQWLKLHGIYRYIFRDFPYGTNCKD